MTVTKHVSSAALRLRGLCVESTAALAAQARRRRLKLRQQKRKKIKSATRIYDISDP